MWALLLSATLATGGIGRASSSTRAIAAMDRTVLRHPDDADVRLRRARLLRDLGRDDEASSDEADAGAMASVRTPDQYLAEGKALWDSAQSQRAIDLWEEAAARFPSDPRILRNLGYARYSSGKYEAAERFYRRAMENAPLDPAIKTDLAWTLLMLQHHADARELAEAVLRSRPEDPAARTILDRIEAVAP